MKSVKAVAAKKKAAVKKSKVSLPDNAKYVAADLYGGDSGEIRIGVYQLIGVAGEANPEPAAVPYVKL